MWPRKVYLDHNATTPPAREVCRAMERCLRHDFGNASSLHTPGRKARGLLDATRRTLADMLKCEPAQVFFTSGGTEGNNAILKGVFGRKGGGHIITTRIEHESILGACRQIEAQGGHVTYVPAGRDGRVKTEDILNARRPDTLLVSVMHGNNETGAVQPVEDIAAALRPWGIPLHVDAVQTFGKLPIDVRKLECEFLTLTAHKIRGPKGCGAIYWRGTTPWQPLICGGHQEQELRAGTEGVHQIVGLGVAARLAAGGMDGQRQKLEGLRRTFVAGLRALSPAAVIHEAASDCQLPGTVNVTFPGREGIRMLAGLDCYEICVSVGSACTADRIEPSHVLLGMGLSEEVALSTLRFSMGATTTQRDIDYTLRVMKVLLNHDPVGFHYLDPQHLDAARVASPRTFLIDLRLPHERMLAPSLPGAHEWSFISFDQHMKDVPRDKDVIMMCGTGIFSITAGYRLAANGHGSVHVVYGGYAAWRNLHGF